MTDYIDAHITHKLASHANAIIRTAHDNAYISAFEGSIYLTHSLRLPHQRSGRCQGSLPIYTLTGEKERYHRYQGVNDDVTPHSIASPNWFDETTQRIAKRAQNVYSKILEVHRIASDISQEMHAQSAALPNSAPHTHHIEYPAGPTTIECILDIHSPSTSFRISIVQGLWRIWGVYTIRVSIYGTYADTSYRTGAGLGSFGRTYYFNPEKNEAKRSTAQRKVPYQKGITELVTTCLQLTN